MTPWTASDLAVVLGITERHITDLVRLEGLPCAEVPWGGKGRTKRTFDPAAVVPWLLDRERRQAEERAPQEPEDTSKARHESAKADLAEAKLAKVRGETLSLADHEGILSSLVLTAKARLQTIAPRLRARIGPENAALVEDEVNAALRALGGQDDGLRHAS